MVGRALSLSDIAPFVRAIQSRPSLQSTSKIPHLGICVSGGPDSMALAYLLRKLQLSSFQKVQLSGWIVDHKARPESTEEARLVQENLDRIGVRSTILTMQWPMDVEPLQLSDFESQARTKRYELLAHAAKTHQIQHLVLGHHQDDQVETIMMRLIRNKSLSFKGLGGMAESWPVPAAFDEFGVHSTNDSATVPARGPFPPRRKTLVQRRGIAENFRIAGSGGVHLQRPLLSFPKTDLIATCEANGVQYIIDPTNNDPQSSLRNAVRHLRKNHKLPKALGGSRLLSLQQHALDHIDRLKAAGEAILATCQISLIDFRSGLVQVRIPFPEYTDQINPDEYAYAVAKLAEIVTPKIRVNYSTQVPSHILIQFFQTREQRKPLVYGGVYFVPDDSQPQTWTLSRQPLKSDEAPLHTKTFTLSNDTAAPGKRHASEFMLWDNRYWIRVFVSDPTVLTHLVIRPLRKEDMESISAPRERLTPYLFSSRKTLLDTARHAAPGRVKFTLPVMTYQGEIVALPTFNYKFTEVLEKMGGVSFQLDVRYNGFSLMDQIPRAYQLIDDEASPARPTRRSRKRGSKSTEDDVEGWNFTLSSR